MSKKNSATIQLAFAALFWGTTFFIMKDLLEVLPPYTMVFIRYFFAAIVVLFYLLYSRRKLTDNFQTGAVLGFILFLAVVPQILGLQYTSASNSGFITGLFVIFTPIFSYIILKDSLSFRSVIAVIGAVIGLWLLTGGIHGANKGDLLTLITALAIGLYNVYVSKFVRKDVDPYILLFQQFLVMSVLIGLCVVLFEIPLDLQISEFAIPMAYLILVPTVLTYALQFRAQKTINATNTSIILTLEPVFAALFAWTIGNEQFVLLSALGGLIIFLSMLISEVPFEKYVKLK